jgi:hypothetical protein
MKLPALPSLPLKRDPKPALARAQLELTQAEGRLSELAMQRGAALVDSDDVQSVAAIDQQLAEVHRTIGILSDRCAALHRQVRALDNEQLEAERQSAVGKLEAAFKKRRAIALELEEAVARLGDLWCQLLESREPALEHWPNLFPRRPAEVLRSRQMERELSWALFAAGRPQMGVTKLPAPGNVGLGVTGISPKGIAGCVQEEHDAILQVLRERALPTETTEEAA